VKALKNRTFLATAYHLRYWTEPGVTVAEYVRYWEKYWAVTAEHLGMEYGQKVEEDWIYFRVLRRNMNIRRNRS